MVQDAQQARSSLIMGFPLHLLLTGEPKDWDRRLVIKNAPGFAILGEPVVISVMLEDQGAAPKESLAELFLSVDENPSTPYNIPLNKFVKIEVPLVHGRYEYSAIFDTPTDR